MIAMLVELLLFLISSKTFPASSLEVSFARSCYENPGVIYSGQAGLTLDKVIAYFLLLVSQNIVLLI